ncbi:uncharacterized protein CANTADRAFT_19103 [Suhomyces tanzawaensis NRRL Y-17324]|uniref:RING-type domain-containing protein n=1 Tax=Suhomyces tanzawaensis NRRL Y-17324 TaxID=984487 RepID=A0A1E4SPL4_9ASCO|nr:uncharacterized protein CANTADRAFT_19103 [Suhomyces tanzawaensis NRRL Y-17324]ODV81470.1 hypothetical protein CANTADRAFT_19103 [Suhomyces tanzawaensis NRRL Y-17324]
MSTETPEYVINIPSDDEGDENDVEIVEFREQTKKLLDNPQNELPLHTTKKLTDIQCPICFDDITMATTTSCGHVFCLDCILQSISSSHARGQVRGRRGIGLCPLCRKSVTFKDTVLLRMKTVATATKPELPPREEENIKIGLETAEEEDEATARKKRKTG